MIGSTPDAVSLRAMAEAIVFAFVSGGKERPRLPAGRRTEVVELLTPLMGDAGLLDAYFEIITAERKRQGVHDLLFELGDEPIPDTLALVGFENLSDDQLADFAIDGHALKSIADWLYNSPDIEPGHWFIDAATREPGASGGHAGESEQTASVIPLPGRPERRSWSRLVAYAAGGTMAASLLIGAGVLIGGSLFRGGEGHELLLAQAEVEPAEGPKGPGDEQRYQVRVLSPLDGFVNFLALEPARKQIVTPGFGGADIPVRAGQASGPIVLPPDTTPVFFVVTSTPAGEPIRRVFEGRNARHYAPDQEEDLRKDLEQLLHEKNYDALAFGSQDVPSRP